jgi:hypothetical protein
VEQDTQAEPVGPGQTTGSAVCGMVLYPGSDLRIVSEALWGRVHDNLAAARAAYFRGTGQLWGRPARGAESKYLRGGRGRCAVCNGSFYVKSRAHGSKKRATVCSNGLEVPMVPTDAAGLTAIEQQVLSADVITTSIQKALARLRDKFNRELAIPSESAYSGA